MLDNTVPLTKRFMFRKKHMCKTGDAEWIDHID